jgi:hypothetical protein
MSVVGLTQSFGEFWELSFPFIHVQSIAGLVLPQ